MGARHTPGPWAVDSYGAGQRVVVPSRAGFGGKAFRIADAHFSADLANTARAPEAAANARLIAAAPDMLAMLKEAADFVQPFNRAADFLDRIEALIAKAEAA